MQHHKTFLIQKINEPPATGMLQSAPVTGEEL